MKIYTLQDLRPISRTLGLSDAEHRILTSLSSGYSKFVSKMAEQAGVPRSSVQYLLGKLKKRGLVESHSTITPYWGKRIGEPRRILWRSDIVKIARRMENVARDIISLTKHQPKQWSLPSKN
ncbi:helix-turn-helix domain-containing protein [Candidatus Parcubacteria bacterium]|nr:helix-turn-helix domain-containing protein [Candidatus Parcubacteria bacterium]